MGRINEVANECVEETKEKILVGIKEYFNNTYTMEMSISDIIHDIENIINMVTR